MKSQETKDYEEGRKIAEQITSVMRSGGTENYDTLQNWILENELSEKVITKLISEDSLEEMLQTYDRKERDSSSDRFLNYLSQKRRSRKRRIIAVWSVSIAAAILTVSFLVHPNSKNENRIEFPSMAYHINLSKNTLNKPTLIFENGSNVDLTAEKAVKEHNLIISENTLSYANKKNIGKEVTYNTLIIPKMYTYNVVLSDGTIVYLNANSELKYPTAFYGDTRKVFLKGEGYFDVKKGEKPFIVQVDDLSVRVYGTKFNINTNNPSSVKTVLLSGSVGLSFKNQKEILIEPNQMMTLDLVKNENQINSVNCERYVAWVGGFFRYDDDKLETVLSEFSAWYGIKFTLSDKKQKDIIVTASFLKTTPLDEIIGVIKLVTNLKFIKTDDGYIIR